MKRERISEEAGFINPFEAFVLLVIFGILAAIAYPVITDSIDRHHLRELRDDSHSLVEDFCEAGNRQDAAGISADYQDTASEYKDLRAEFIQNQAVSEEFPDIELPYLQSEVLTECPDQVRLLTGHKPLQGEPTSTDG